MKESGKIIICTALVSIHGPTEESTKEIIITIKSMGMGFIPGLVKLQFMNAIKTQFLYKDGRRYEG